MKPILKACMYWFALLLTVLWMVSCGTNRTFTNSQTIKDSTWVKKTVKPFDTVVKIPGNKAKVSVTINDLATGRQFETRSNNLTATLRQHGDTITADCNVEPYELAIQLQREIIEMYRQRELEKNTTQTVSETKAPWYFIPVLLIEGVAIVLLLIKSFIPKKTNT